MGLRFALIDSLRVKRLAAGRGAHTLASDVCGTVYTASPGRKDPGPI